MTRVTSKFPTSFCPVFEAETQDAASLARDEDNHKLREASAVALAKAILRTDQFGKFPTAHDGFGKLLEEVDELKEHVWTKERLRDLDKMKAEALGIAVVALRFAAFTCDEEIGRR